MAKNKIGKLLIAAALLSSLTWIAHTKYNQHLMRHLSDTITLESPQLGAGAHLLLPNLSDARVVAPDRPHDPIEVQAEDRFKRIQRLRSFLVTTNSLGYRSPELDSSSKIRIVAIGDSVTFGWGVAYEDSYPAILEELLNQKGSSTEVVNVGVPAMKPRHMAKWAELNLKELRPDLVLVARRPDWMEPNPLNNYRDALNRIQRSAGQAQVGLILPPISSFDVKGRSMAKYELEEISKRWKGPLLDLTATFEQKKGTSGVDLKLVAGEQILIDRTSNSELVRCKSPPDIPGTPSLCAEIVSTFESDSSIKEPLFFDGGHPDKEGFAHFAKAVLSWINSEQLLKNPLPNKQ